jgi:hypothetical protein
MVHRAGGRRTRARARDGSVKTDWPKLYPVGVSRTGGEPDGQFDGGADDSGERANWAAGVQVVFPNRSLVPGRAGINASALTRRTPL